MRLKLGTTFNPARAITNIVAILNRTEFLAPSDFEYEDFSTTLTSYGAIHTFANIEYAVARGRLINNEFRFYITVSFDITAGAGAILLLDIPYTLRGGSSEIQFADCDCNEGGAVLPGTAGANGGTNSFYIRNSLGANFTVAPGKFIYLRGTVEIQ